MELFYSKHIADGADYLDAEESGHCIKVLRHRAGDVIHIVDGCGTLYKCEIIDDNPKKLLFSVKETIDNYGSHPYRLNMAVAPPKNIDRFEWFAEKATEIGVDEITPLFGEYSERKVFKGERVERLMISAAKQSHKGAIPTLNEAFKVKDFILQPQSGVKLICYCDEVGSIDGATKISINEALSTLGGKDVTIMIGPEGDFSRSEIELAISNGWQCVSLGESRLRIETAALVAVSSVYLRNISISPESPTLMTCDALPVEPSSR